MKIKNDKITEAIEYILLHIGEGLTLESIASHLNMSVSNFCRQFKKQTGQSVYSFIKKLKLEQSAMRLKMEKGRSITDIGEDYGYSASNFSTVFSQIYNLSPTEFRETVHKTTKEADRIYQELNGKIRIEERPEYLVTYERSIGNYSELKVAWCKFVEKYKSYASNAIFFERTFDDPSITDKDKCIFDICMSIENKTGFPNTCTISGGKYAVYPFKGCLNEIYALNQQIVGIWFPKSNYTIDERYSYDQYHLVREDGYMEFDICLPIK